MSFLSNYGNVIDATVAEIEQKTSICEVFEPSFNIPVSPICDDNAEPTESAVYFTQTCK